MKRFTQLYEELDRTTSTNAKVAAMVRYFEDADPRDCAWAVFFLSGDRLRSPVKRRNMRAWAQELAKVPEWLFDESYATVGDMAETFTLLLETAPRIEDAEDKPLWHWVEERLRPLRKLDEDEQKEKLTRWWRELDGSELFVMNKLITGALRVGVSKRLVLRALSKFSGIPKAGIAHRLMGNWEPNEQGFEALVSEDVTDADASRPYPWFLASPLEKEFAEFSEEWELEEWQVEWKWDGIRGQLVRREGEAFLWSRGEELVTDQYPEIRDGSLEDLPDGLVLDGEILAWDGAPMPFAELQRRIGRKRVGKKIRREVPVRFVAYDILEESGEDLREMPQEERRERLERLMASQGEELDRWLGISELVEAESWDELAELRDTARERLVEGLMLKRKSSPYRAGRVRGDWWKWKIDPLTIDAVLIYAQPGSGRRANLFTDYTFAVWADEETLVPVAKAYSGLSNDEIRKLDHWIRRNTKERFGPVRSVEPHHVFEISFEGIRPSNRHKSGVAVRFPRITRWRKDLGIRDAETLEQVKGMIPDALD